VYPNFSIAIINASAWMGSSSMASMRMGGMVGGRNIEIVEIHHCSFSSNFALDHLPVDGLSVPGNYYFLVFYVEGGEGLEILGQLIRIWMDESQSSSNGDGANWWHGA